MSTVTNAPPEIAAQQLPAVPLTLEGASMLHQMLRMRWTAWKQLPVESAPRSPPKRLSVLGDMEQEASGQSAIFSLLGHKGDLILVHFRRSFDDLNQGGAEAGRARALGLPGADVVVFVGGGVGPVRIEPQDIRSFGGRGGSLRFRPNGLLRSSK